MAFASYMHYIRYNAKHKHLGYKLSSYNIAIHIHVTKVHGYKAVKIQLDISSYVAR